MHGQSDEVSRLLKRVVVLPLIKLNLLEAHPLTGPATLLDASVELLDHALDLSAFVLELELQGTSLT